MISAKVAPNCRALIAGCLAKTVATMDLVVCGLATFALTTVMGSPGWSASSTISDDAASSSVPAPEEKGGRIGTADARATAMLTCF